LPPKVFSTAGAIGTIPYPVLPPFGLAVSVIATWYVAPGAGVAVLGVAVTVVVAPVALAWQPVQFDALGVACAGVGLMVATRTAAVRPVTSTATLGMVILFRL